MASGEKPLSPLPGDRTAAHEVDVDEDVSTGNPPAPRDQLMSNRELTPRSVQGDRFDAEDDDVSYAPEVEDNPEADDILPDEIEPMPGRRAEPEQETEVTARPKEPIRPILPSELPEG